MSGELLLDLIAATGATLYMTLISSVFIVLVGLPLGVALVVLERGGIVARPLLHRVLATIVNAGRSIPFIILMVAVVPLTRLVVGTSIGTTAVIPPLVIAAIPFFGRVVEQCLREVEAGLIEAAVAMGSSPRQIIFKVLLPEAVPALIRGVALMVISVIGYSAMAGAIGGGGLGDLAVKYGYMRFQNDVMLGCVLVLLVLVQLIQLAGDRWAVRRCHK